MAQTEKGIIYPYDYNEVADVPADFKALAESIDALLNNYSLNTDSGNKIVLEMNNTTYKIKAVLKDKDDNVISTSNEIDLPLENMVTNISYNEQTLTLTHQDGHTTEVSIADLISDLASKEEVTELQSQVDDLTTLVETELESNEVEGTEIDVSDSAEYRGRIEVKGNTYQKQLSGKNRFALQNINQTLNGITLKYDAEKQEFLANGTCTSDNTVFNLFFWTKQFIGALTTVSAHYLEGSVDNYAVLRNYDTNFEGNTPLYLTDLNSLRPVVSKTSESTYQPEKFSIRFNNGSVANNFRFKVMVADSIDTTYEPYCGGQPSPNPDYPQEIKVVTGDNVIKHRGKNMFDVDSLSFKNGYYDATGAYRTGNNNGIFEFIKVLQNSDYTLSVNKAFSFIAINEFDENKNFIKRTQIQQGRISTISTDVNTVYLAISFNLDSTTTITKLLLKDFEPQLEEGTEATSYEPYREESYNLDLWKENEFDKENVLSGYNINATTSKIANVSSSTLVYMSCKPNTTYKISKILSSRFGVGTTREIPAANSTVYNYIRKDGKTEIIIKTGTQDTYIVAWVHTTTYDTEITVQEILDSIQIQEAIELCKIGDYEDIPFKNVVGDENYNAELENGAWYKKGIIGKTTDVSGSTGKTIDNMLSSSNIYSYYGGTVSNRTITYDSAISGTNTIYYVLETPTYTQITNTTLISQLEALKKAKWFKGVNHFWTETENLEPNLKGTYKQSNNIKNKERDERLDNLESRLALLE